MIRRVGVVVGVVGSLKGAAIAAMREVQKADEQWELWLFFPPLFFVSWWNRIKAIS